MGNVRDKTELKSFIKNEENFRGEIGKLREAKKKLSIISCWKINFGQKHFQIDKTHFLLEDKNTFSVNSLNII